MICLRTCLAGLGPAGLLIIDGNNYLYRQSPLYGSHLEADFPGQAHREALVADAKDALASVSSLGSRPFLDARSAVGATASSLAELPAPRIDLWFDGPEFEVLHPAPGLRVIYSGGRGKDRADRGILEFLRSHITVRAVAATLLLTKDKGLGKRARRWVAVA